MCTSLFYISENSLDNFDTDLQTFYYEVLSKEINLRNAANVTRIRQALRNVVHAYKKETVTSNSSKILFDSSEKRCAYVLKHCPCFASAVAKHFLQLMRKNSGLLNQAFYNRQVNLCCLGGGPGTEAVAITKIINLLKNSVLPLSKEKIHLKIIEIDLSEDWRSTTQLILKSVQRNPLFCDSERIYISFKLIKADLTEPFKEEVERALQEADIITMVYFVSAVNGSKAQDRCVPMLQNIMEQTKPGALLFFLDSAKQLHYESMMDSISKVRYLRFIHGPFFDKFHTLSAKSIRMFIKLYFGLFNAVLCLTDCFITCACWIKETNTTSEDQYKDFMATNRLISTNSNLQGIRNRKLIKLIEYKTRQQARFRKKVEKLIRSEIEMDFETGESEENDDKMDTELYFYPEKIIYAGKAKNKRIILSLE